MAKRVYINRRTGRGREFIGCAAIVGLIGVLLTLALFFCFGTWFSYDNLSEKSRQEAAVDDGSQVGGAEISSGEELEQKGTAVTIGGGNARFLWRMVRNSSLIRGNDLYDAVAENIVFRFEPEDDSVNAYATVSHEESAQSCTLIVCLLGGAVRFSRLIGMAVASDADGSNAVLSKVIAKLPDDAYSELSEESASLFAKTNGLDRVLSDPKKAELVSRISSGILLGILAHEAGHHVLGHCHGGCRGNFEISRNQEREADSFASSVISASPFGKDILYGRLLWYKALSIQEQRDQKDAKKEEMLRTHPYSKERYENFIRANAQKARELGLTL